MKEQKIRKIMRLVRVKERRIGRLVYLRKKDGSKIKRGELFMREIKEKIKLWNFLDEGKIRGGEIRPHEEESIIDTGALRMAIPERIARELKLLRAEKKAPVEYADGRIEERDVAIGLCIEVMGRETETRAIIEPNGKEILVGMLILEDLDLFIDTKNGKIIPNPESPDRPLYKMREER